LFNALKKENTIFELWLEVDDSPIIPHYKENNNNFEVCLARTKIALRSLFNRID
jgi:hypothetical protein